MNRRRRFVDPDERPPEHQPRAWRGRRQRTRDWDWHTERESAQTVQCPGPPTGCRAPIGQTCRNPRTGDELGQQPAHAARIDRARAAEPAQLTTDQAAHTATEETR